MGKINIPKTSSSAFHNSLLLLLVILGNFILYRYIKNIEKDTKILHTYILELNEKIKQPRGVQNSVQDVDSLKKSPNVVHSNGDAENDEDSESIGSQDITNLLKKVMFPEEDDELMNVLHCVGVQDISFDECDDKIVIADVFDEVDNEPTKSTECVTEYEDKDVQDESELEQNLNTNSEEQIVPLLSLGSEVLHGGTKCETPIDVDTSSDEIFLKTSTSNDKKKYTSLTNEELKKLLKEKGLSTKGVKSELVMRIMDNE